MKRAYKNRPVGTAAATYHAPSIQKVIFHSLLANTSLVILLLFLSACSAAPTRKKGSIELRFALQKGDSYTLKTVDTLKIEQKIGGKRFMIQQEVETSSRQTLIHREKNGESLLEIVYTGIKIDRYSGSENLKFDSSKKGLPKSHEMAAYRALIGKKLILRTDRFGWPLSIEGIKNVVAEAMKNQKFNNETEKKSALNTLEYQFGENNIIESLRSAAFLYPDSPVSAGDRWSKKFRRLHSLPAIIQSEWSVSKIEKTRIEIAQRSDITEDKNSDFINIGTAMVKYSLNGKQGGFIYLDKETGIPLESKLAQETQGEMHVKSPTGKILTIPMTINKITVSSISAISNAP